VVEIKGKQKNRAQNNSNGATVKPAGGLICRLFDVCQTWCEQRLPENLQV